MTDKLGFLAITMFLYNLLIAIVLGVVGVLIAIGIYMVIDRKIPVEYTATVINYDVKLGEKLKIHYEVDRKKLCEVGRSSVVRASNNRRFDYDIVWVASPGKLGKDSYDLEVDLPKDIPLGPAIITQAIQWKCRPNFYQEWNPITDSRAYKFNIITGE